jgi:hypothetical protein
VLHTGTPVLPVSGQAAAASGIVADALDAGLDDELKGRV